MIAEPPLLTGAVHEIVACAFPKAPDTPVGAPGNVAGMTLALASEELPSPTAFEALTQKT